MKLGLVGLLPNDIRTLTAQHLRAIQSLKLTGACFHVDSELLFELTEADYQQVKLLYADHGMTLAQMGIGYSQCLFDPDYAVRQHVINIISQGIQAAQEFNADVALIRTGSLNPTGSYSAYKKNHAPEAMGVLIDTLRTIATLAESAGQTIVIETHVLTILNSPELIVEVTRQVGSDRVRIVMDYVNHFQTLSQIYSSASRLNYIFDTMGALCPVAHIKDISVRNNFVLHFDEALPGEGELDLACAVRHWQRLRPDGYMLLEHLPAEAYARAAANVMRIAQEAGVPIT